MPKHESTRPPPAANPGLDLDDVLNNPAPTKPANRKAMTSFPATAQKSTRIKTEHAPLGDPGRTVLEGLAVPTILQTVVDPTVVPFSQFHGMAPPSRVGNDPAHTPSIYSAAPSTKSTAPTWAKSVLTKPEDQEMASRQTAFASLSPVEQAKQNTWAQGIITRSIRCPQGYDWDRNEEKHGYRCAGGHHFVTDDLLAEGKGGVLLVPGGRGSQMELWWGPYYPDPKKPERLVYGGDQAGSHFSLFGPDWTDVKTQTWHWPKVWQLIKGLKGPPGNEADYPLLEQHLPSFFCRPLKIHSDSHGATLILRKDMINVPDPIRSLPYGNAGSGSGSGAGSGTSWACSQRSSSESRTDDLCSQVPSSEALQGSQGGSAHLSPGSPSDKGHNSTSGSAAPSPGSRRSPPPPYHNDINAFGTPSSGYRPSNPFGLAQPPKASFRPSSNSLWNLTKQSYVSS